MMVAHKQFPHEENPLVQDILALNDKRVHAHVREKKMRQEWRAEHPFHLIYIGCMDGRHSHFPQTLGIPVGCCDIFQHPGAKFKTHWPYFITLLTDSIETGLYAGQQVVIFVSSHYSALHHDHGCRAFNNNRTSATDHILTFTRDLKDLYADFPDDIHIIPVEVNTDNDAITFIGEDHLTTAHAHAMGDAESMRQQIRRYCNTANNEKLVNLLFEFVTTNRAHVQQVLQTPRAHTDCCHNETVLAVGRGFNTWLNMERNRGIILFPDGDHDLDRGIEIAGNILLENSKNNPFLEEHGALAIACSAYSEQKKMRIATARALGYAERVQRILTSRVPDLRFIVFSGVVHLSTWKLTPVAA